VPVGVGILAGGCMADTLVGQRAGRSSAILTQVASVRLQAAPASGQTLEVIVVLFSILSSGGTASPE
jgi:hypothetical protein